MSAGIFRNSKVDRAPGGKTKPASCILDPNTHPDVLADLTFGEMNFLKNGKPQEAIKSVPKSRASDQKRNQKELEDIEVFFSRRSPDILHSNKTSRDKGEQHNPKEPSARGGSPRTKTRSSRASLASKATTYMSWSSSNHPPMRPEETRSELSNGPVSLRSGHSRKQSQTPQSVQQALIETGIYRPLAPPEQHIYGPVNGILEEISGGHDVETETAECRPFDGVSAGASDSRDHNAQQAYTLRRDHVPPPQEGAPRPPDSPKPENGSDPGTQEVPILPWHDKNVRYVSFDRSQTHGTQQTIPSLRFAVCSTNSSISNQFQGAAAQTPQIRPPSSLRYAASIFPPGPPLGPRPNRLPGNVPVVSDAGRRFPETTSSPHPPRGLGQLEDRIPESYASHGRYNPPRGGMDRGSMHGYIENMERKMLGDNDENLPPALSSPDAGLQDPYLTPYFRHWPAEDTWAAPRHAPRGQAVLEGKDLPLDRHQGTRWPAGIDDKADSSTSRFWKPNTFGL